MLSNLYGKKLESSLSQLVDYGKSWSLDPADLATFTEEILNGKLYFCAVTVPKYKSNIVMIFVIFNLLYLLCLVSNKKFGRCRFYAKINRWTYYSFHASLIELPWRRVTFSENFTKSNTTL